jgi:hypothetical protein
MEYRQVSVLHLVLQALRLPDRNPRCGVHDKYPEDWEICSSVVETKWYWPRAGEEVDDADTAVCVCF